MPCNCNLYDISALQHVDAKSLCAVLNSTLVGLYKYHFGRIMGGDPMLKSEVVDMKMMPVPDPRAASEDVRVRLACALDSIAQRGIGHLVAVDEVGNEPSGDLAMADRQQLDDAVLEMLGIADPAERKELLTELYAEVTRLLRSIRTAERIMQAFRSQSTRKGRPSPRSIAKEIWEALPEAPPYRTALAFVPTTDSEEMDLPEGKATVVEAELWTPAGVKIGRHLIPMENRTRALFIKSLADSGLHGAVEIPREPKLCQQAMQRHEEYMADLEERFADLAADHTSDEQMQQKVVRELWRLARNAAGG